MSVSGHIAFTEKNTETMAVWKVPIPYKNGRGNRIFYVYQKQYVNRCVQIVHCKPYIYFSRY